MAAGPAAGQATIEWRRLAADKHVSIDIASKLWEQAKAAAADPVKRSDLFRKLIEEAAKSPGASPEPGKQTLVDAPPTDPAAAAAAGPGKTTQVLLDKDQKPGAVKPAEEAKDAAAPAPAAAVPAKDAAAANDAGAAPPGTEAKKADAPTAKPTVDKVRADLSAAAQAAKDVAAMLAEVDPATIMEALRQIRDGEPNLLHKILTVAGGAIEARIGQKFPDPTQTQTAGPVGIRVPYDSGAGTQTHFISDAGVPMAGAPPVSVAAKVAEWTAEIKKRDAANQDVAQSVARVSGLNATATDQASKAKLGDEAAKKALEQTQTQLATELGTASRQVAQPPSAAPATEKSKHGEGPPPAGWREQVAATIASEKVAADDPGHTYHVLKTGAAVATSTESELKKPIADLAAARAGVITTPDPQAADPTQPPPGLKSPPAIEQAAPGTLIGNPLPDMAQGHSVLSALSQGNQDGLGPVGVGTLPFLANRIEWGLDQWVPPPATSATPAGPAPAPTSSNVFRIIKGDQGGVPVLPNYVRHGHSHPNRNEDITGHELNLEKGKTPGSGSMKLNDLLNLSRPRSFILPSASDFHWTFQHNVPRHIVHTPYSVNPQTLEVFNPGTTVIVQQGQPLAFVIDRSLFRHEGMSYVGELIGTAGGAEVWRGQFNAPAVEHFLHASPSITSQSAVAQQPLAPAGAQPAGGLTPTPEQGGSTLAAQPPKENEPQPQPQTPTPQAPTPQAQEPAPQKQQPPAAEQQQPAQQQQLAPTQQQALSPDEQAAAAAAAAIAERHQRAVAALASIPMAIGKTANATRGYLVTREDGQRMIALLNDIKGAEKREWPAGLLVRIEDQEWYFEYQNQPTEQAAADGPAKEVNGLPEGNVKTVTMFGYSGVRNINGLPTKQCSQEQKDEVEIARQTDPLIVAGHVGFSFDGGATIYGMTPASGPMPGVPGTEERRVALDAVIARLQKREVFPGMVKVDNAHFAFAAEKAAKGWDTETVSVVLTMDPEAYADLRKRVLKDVADSEAGKHEHGYTFPPADRSPQQDAVTANGVPYTAAHIGNCAIYPRIVGLPVPEQTGRMNASKGFPGYMDKLREWSTAPAPIPGNPGQ